MEVREKCPIMSGMDTHLVVHTRLPAEPCNRLRAHAHELGRSLNQETRVWLELGAAMSVYASLIDPRASLAMPDKEELEAMCAEALLVMRDAMARALPHYIAPEVTIRAFTPIPSRN